MESLQLPEKLKLSFLLADVYISHIFLHICLCVFAYLLCFYVYFWIFSHEIDSLISEGGAGGAPHPLVYQFHMKQIKDIYTKPQHNIKIQLTFHKNI